MFSNKDFTQIRAFKNTAFGVSTSIMDYLNYTEDNVRV